MAKRKRPDPTETFVVATDGYDGGAEGQPRMYQKTCTLRALVKKLAAWRIDDDVDRAAFDEMTERELIRWFENDDSGPFVQVWSVTRGKQVIGK